MLLPLDTSGRHSPCTCWGGGSLPVLAPLEPGCLLCTWMQGAGSGARGATVNEGGPGSQAEAPSFVPSRPSSSPPARWLPGGGGECASARGPEALALFGGRRRLLRRPQPSRGFRGRGSRCRRALLPPAVTPGSGRVRSTWPGLPRRGCRRAGSRCTGRQAQGPLQTRSRWLLTL